MKRVSSSKAKTIASTIKAIGSNYFWNLEYKHWLRDCSMAARKKVLRDFLKHNLPLDGESPAHEAIVLKHCENDSTLRRKHGTHVRPNMPSIEFVHVERKR